jgi:hypothetical protein
MVKQPDEIQEVACGTVEVVQALQVHPDHSLQRDTDK